MNRKIKMENKNKSTEMNLCTTFENREKTNKVASMQYGAHCENIVNYDERSNTLWKFERLLIKNISYANSLLKTLKLNVAEKANFKALLKWISAAFRCIGIENSKTWYLNSSYKIQGDARFLIYRYFFNPFFNYETGFEIDYDWHNTIFELVPDKDMTSFIRIPILVSGLYNYRSDIYCNNCGYKLPAYDLEEILGISRARLYPFCYTHSLDCIHSSSTNEVFGDM